MKDYTNLNTYDYFLPEELIAQTPIEPRDHSRLIVFDRQSKDIEHKHFYDIADYLKAGDVLVINNTRVLPARLYGYKSTGCTDDGLQSSDGKGYTEGLFRRSSYG